jgi:hypothetical protein
VAFEYGAISMVFVALLVCGVYVKSGKNKKENGLKKRIKIILTVSGTIYEIAKAKGGRW